MSIAQPPPLPLPLPGEPPKPSRRQVKQAIRTLAFLAALAATAATTYWISEDLPTPTLSWTSPSTQNTHTAAEQAFLRLNGGVARDLDLARSACAELPRHFQPANPGFGVQEAGGAYAQHHRRPYTSGVRLLTAAIESGMCAQD